MNDYATYSPEDNKLRLYVGRVPRDEYEKLRAEGWTSTPKQGCDFVAVWTPERLQTALDYADGELLDEDQGPAERAADRAERFAGYREKRTAEACGHADTYEAGPQVHGFQSQARAERAAGKLDRFARYAGDAWSKAEYWQQRTAGVIAHALQPATGRVVSVAVRVPKVTGYVYRSRNVAGTDYALSQIDYAMEEQRPRFERLADRHTNGAAPRAVSAFQLFQTPAPLAAELVAALDLRPGSRILEPSAGLGRILDALQATAPAEIVAVEIAPQCAAELFRQERPAVRLMQRDFLATTPAELGFFDAVAMNPPFHMRADIRHIMHALDFLRPGGRLAAICMDTPHRAAALRGMADTWTPIPAGAFRSEGTNTPTVLLTITKR